MHFVAASPGASNAVEAAELLLEARSDPVGRVAA